MKIQSTPYTRRKLEEWSHDQKEQYYLAYRAGNVRAMVAATPDAEGATENDRQICRANLRYFIGEEIREEQQCLSDSTS